MIRLPDSTCSLEEDAALFIVEDRSIPPEMDSKVPFSEILICIREHDSLSWAENSNSLLPLILAATSVDFEICNLVHLIYTHLPGATMDVRVFDEPLSSTQWGKSILKDTKSRYSRETALSCIKFFETGKSDVSPHKLRDVFAMSCRNSIYIAEQVR